MGNRTTNAYDAANRRTSVTNALNEVTQFGYDPVGNLTSVTMPDGAVYRKTYYPNNRLFEETDPLNHTTRHIYDPAGNEVMLVKPRGNQFRKVYDKLSRVVKDIGPLPGMEVQYFYDAASQRVRTLLPNGGEILEEYDLDGRRTRLTDPEGGIRETVYYRNGYVKQENIWLAWNPPVLSESGPENVYDTLGRLVERRDPLPPPAGGSIRYEYYDSGLEKSWTNPAGYSVVKAYDDLGRLSSETDTWNQVRRYEHDLNGNRTKVIQPNGAEIETVYDALNRPIDVIRRYLDDGVLRETHQRTEYNSRGMVSATVGENGNRAEFLHDLAARLTRITEAVGIFNYQLEFELDPNGNIIKQTDAEGRDILIDYDMADRPIKATLPTLGYVLIEWDLMNNNTRVVDHNGREMTWTFDRRNMARSFRVDGLLQSETEYNAAGRITRTVDPTGAEVVLERDLMGRIIANRFRPDPNDPSQDIVRQFTLDAQGNPVATTDPRGNIWRRVFDTKGRQTELINPLGKSFILEYDGMDNVTARIDFNGNRTEFSYNGRNQIKKAVYPDLSEATFNWCCCLPTAYTNSLGTTRIGYDILHRINETTDPFGNRLRYTHNGANNVTQMQLPDLSVMSVRHNVLDLVEEVTPPDNLGLRVGYDEMGRRTSETHANGFQAQHTFASAQRLTQTLWTHPVSGTQLQTQPSYIAGTARPAQFTEAQTAGGPLPISDKLYSKLWEIEYYPNKNLKREELKDPQGHPVLRLLYQWDKQNNLTQVREDISGWQADLMWNAANHLTSVQTTAGTGPNPFPLPPGLTTVTTDDSGNILEMVNGDWVARFAYDYENRPTRIEWPGEPVVEPLWDAVGRLQGYGWRPAGGGARRE
jgi:YD repeat-containing protein